MFCSRCRQSVAPESTQCPACGQSTGVRPVPRPYPSSPWQTRIAVPQVSVSYAGFWMRFLAWMIDQAMVTGLAMIVLGKLISLARVGSIFRGLEPLDDSGDDWYAILGLGATAGFVLFYLVMSWLYHALMESSAWQGTIGKRALGIVVTDLSGTKIDFGRASGRFFSRFVTNLIPLGMGFIAVAFTQRKQAVHDLISSCLVLRKA